MEKMSIFPRCLYKEGDCSMKSAQGSTNKGRRSAIDRTNQAGLFFVLPFLIMFLIFNIYPVFHSLYLSFFSWNGLGEMKPVGLGNYIRLFTVDPYFWKSIANTLIILVAYLPTTIVLAILLAALLNHKLVRGQHFFQTAWFLPYVVAPVSIGMLFRLLFDWSDGLVNNFLTKLGLVGTGVNWLGDPQLIRIVLVILLIWSSLGYVTTLFLAGMTNISEDILDAAEVDGATYFQTLLHVKIPLLKPVITFVLITGVISSLQLYDAPRLLASPGIGASAAGGPGRSLLTAIWYMVDSAMGESTGNPQIGYGAAISYGLFLVTAVFSFVNYIMLRRGGGENYE